jgi:predicted nucleic acid-binding protein
VAGLTLDAGALIAYERGEPRVREILATAFARGLVPTVPAVAIAEVWRGDARDARVARLLKVSRIEPLDEARAREAEALRRSVPGTGTIDACIAFGVAQRGDAVATSDPHEMRTLPGSNATILAVGLLLDRGAQHERTGAPREADPDLDCPI